MDRADGMTHGGEGFDFLATVAAAMLQTPAAQAVSARLLEDMAATWAGRSAVKRALADRVVREASRVMRDPARSATPLAAAPLWSSPAAAPAALSAIMDLINTFLAILVQAEASFAQLPPEVRAESLKKALARFDAGKAGALLTAVAKTLTAVHRSDPAYLARVLAPPLNEFMKSTDFGEIAEAVDTAGDALVAAAGMVGRLLWEYPSKLACLGAAETALVNILVRSLHEMVKPLEDAAPESLADLLCAFFRTIEGEQIALLVNTWAELIRKLHTGSVLLGEGGRSLFEIDLTDKLRTALPSVDPLALRKAKVALAENRESVAAARAEAHADHPPLLLELLSHWADLQNPRIRSLSRKIGAFERLPADAAAAAAAQGMAELDVQEAGEIVNSLLRLLNRLHTAAPRAGIDVLTGVATALDREVLEEAATWMIADAVDAFRPLATAVMPPLLRGVAELLTPLPGEDARGLDEALARLRSCLNGTGGPV
jgi:hypothetical protein